MTGGREGEARGVESGRSSSPSGLRSVAVVGFLRGDAVGLRTLPFVAPCGVVGRVDVDAGGT